MSSNKIKTIIESLISAPMKEVRTQVSYLSFSLTEEEKFDLYEKLSSLLATFAEDYKIEKKSTSEITNLNAEYTELVKARISYEDFVSKVDYILSKIQPISDHSIRGTLHYIKKNID